MRTVIRKKLAKTLDRLEAILKCGGPGSGRPGPCPSDHARAASGRMPNPASVIQNALKQLPKALIQAANNLGNMHEDIKAEMRSYFSLSKDKMGKLGAAIFVATSLQMVAEGFHPGEDAHPHIEDPSLDYVHDNAIVAMVSEAPRYFNVGQGPPVPGMFQGKSVSDDRMPNRQEVIDQVKDWMTRFLIVGFSDQDIERAVDKVLG